MRLYPWFEALQSPLAQTFEQDARHEATVNKWRVTLVLFLAVVPLSAVVGEGFLPENFIGFFAVGLALLYCLAVYLLLKRASFLPALKYVTVGLDATLVSAMLVAFMLAGRAIIATNSQVAFLAYFLVLAMIGRRYDVKVASFGGAVVVAEYILVILIGYLFFDVPDLPADPLYGSFSWPSQFGRAILLVLCSMIMVTTVRSDRDLRELSIRDSLLGIFNRRYFEDVLALVFRTSRQQGNPMTVVMLDVDHFKEYNDRFGHLRGDRVLVAISDFLVRNLRRNDVLARYGGDEFVLLLMETPPEGAGVTLGRLQNQMKRWLRDAVEESDTPITLSFGVATLAAADTHHVQLLNRADRHLYQAKTAGGGVICDEEGRIVPEEVTDSP